MIAAARPTPNRPVDDSWGEARQVGPTPRWWPLAHHDEQVKAITSQSRFIAMDSGRRSGKTDIAKRKIVRSLREKKPWPDPRYFYGLPTRDWAKRVAWIDFQRLIPKYWIDDISQGELWVRTIFGSTLFLLGMDEPSRIEGSPWDGGVLDEMSDQRPGCFDLHVRPALDTVENGVNRAGWCWLIGKPSRQGCGAAWFRAFCERCRRSEYPDGEAFSWPSWDILPADVIQQARETLDPKDFNEQYGACWESAGGAVFHAFDREYNVRPCAYRPDAPILVGQDFNMDPMAWILCHRFGNRLEAFDELWLRNTGTVEALDVLASRYAGHRGSWQFYGDSNWARARKTSATQTDLATINNDERFIKMGRTMHYTSSNPALEDRYAACNALLCNAANECRAFIDPKCTHFISDMETLAYKTGTREVQKLPFSGHISDGWGYIVYRLFPIRMRMDEAESVVTMSEGS